MVDFGPASMTREEADAFLGAEFKTEEESLKAALATLRKDGSPLVVPVGFLYDGNYLYFAFSPTRGAIKRIRRDPRVSVSVFRQHSPAKFVTVSGVAEEIPDPNLSISRRLVRRYPRPASWDVDAWEKNWLAAGKVVFRLEMKNWTGMDNSKPEDIGSVAQLPADWALLRGQEGH